MVSPVVTIPQALASAWRLDSTVARSCAPNRLPEFVVGPENALARATMDGLIAVLQQSVEHAAPPEFDAWQPLTLAGPTGVGKSLFVHTLIRAWQALRPSDSITLTTAADFAREYVDAIDRRTINTWRETIRSSQLVVLDDLPQLADKPSAQTEWVHTLDALHERGGLALVQTRTPLDRLRGALSPALLSRLNLGVCVELHAPECDTRQEILRRYCELRGVSIQPAALRQLAQGLRQNVPELFAAVMTLESRSKRQPATIELAEVRDYVEDVEQLQTPSLRAIAQHTARHFTLTLADLKSASRRQAIVQARDVAMYLARQLTGKSLDEIGQFFGGRDHTTVLHGCRKTEQVIKTDTTIRQAVDVVQSELRLG